MSGTTNPRRRPPLPLLLLCLSSLLGLGSAAGSPAGEPSPSAALAPGAVPTIEVAEALSSSSSKKKRKKKRRPAERKRYFFDEDPWEEYQEGGHCLYGTNGELLHSPDGRPCSPTGQADTPPAPAGTGSEPAPRPSVPRGREACVAGNCRSGFGTYSWADGSRYTGGFRDGKLHGQGTLIYSDGGSYAGEWKDGKRHGYGRAAYASGRSQTGLWDEGQFAGAAPADAAPASRGYAGGGIRWPDLSRAAPQTGGGARDAALIVGLEHYAHVPEIPRASDNAAAWFQYFVRTRGVPVEHVTLLLDEDGTREEVLYALERAAAQARRGGTLWFVFIGHGAPSRVDGDGLLVGFDAQQKVRSLEARSLPRSELLAALERSRASRIQVLLDACFSGRSGNGDPLIAGLQPLVITHAGASDDPRTSLFTAARGDEYAGPLPGAGRPAFSYLALGGLRGWADADGDGRVTNGELHGYVSRVMQALVRDRHQQPTLEGPMDLAIARSAREEGPDLADLVLESARTDR
ncbi:MAG TPA: caspase family protein [Myxococcota bacterium]